MSMTVLTVDDSRTMREMLRLALADAGFRVVQAEDGIHGLEVLQAEQPQVIVTDINMPDIHGLELLSFMRKSEAHATTPVVIVSTEGAERDRERGMALGANAYLSKPFEPENLRATVRRVLHGAGK